METPKMKLTKESLKKIIQEELEAMTSENKGYDSMVSGFQRAMEKALKDYANMAMRGQTPETQERIKSMKRLMGQALITGVSNLKDYEEKQGREFGDTVDDKEATDRLHYALKEEQTKGN